MKARGASWFHSKLLICSLKLPRGAILVAEKPRLRRLGDLRASNSLDVVSLGLPLEGDAAQQWEPHVIASLPARCDAVLLAAASWMPLPDVAFAEVQALTGERGIRFAGGRPGMFRRGEPSLRQVGALYACLCRWNCTMPWQTEAESAPIASVELVLDWFCVHNERNGIWNPTKSLSLACEALQGESACTSLHPDSPPWRLLLCLR